jgi:hypothetical protein
MSAPPWTDYQSLNLWTGTYAQLVAAYPTPSIWNGAGVFTSDKGWTIWLTNQGWFALWTWYGNNPQFPS